MIHGRAVVVVDGRREAVERVSATNAVVVRSSYKASARRTSRFRAVALPYDFIFILPRRTGRSEVHFAVARARQEL